MRKIKLFLGIAVSSLILTACDNSPTPHQHEWGEVTYTWSDDNSNCTATRVCLKNPDHVETETKSSTYSEISPAGCESDGTGRYSVSFDSEVFGSKDKEITIPATGHNWGTPIYTLNGHSEMTASRVCLIDTNHVQEETVEGAYEVITPATENTEGLARYTFTFENTAFTTQTHDAKLSKLINGATPTLSDDGKTMTYGLYPKTHIGDETIIDALDDIYWEGQIEDNGWYIYEGDYYTKYYCSSPFYTGSNQGYFDDGEEIKQYRSYWFKCEPIVWNVLSVNKDEYLLLSSELLYSRSYHSSTSNRSIDGKTVYPNNYQHSDIREWLNEDFFNTAFNLGNEYIQATTVDNSAASTASSTNQYACDDTEDKVFILSYQDYLNPDYGFSSNSYQSSTRAAKTTDYARATGAYYSQSSSTLYNGYIWTRSPTSGYYNYVNYITSDGGFLFNEAVIKAYRCIRPAITVKLL